MWISFSIWHYKILIKWPWTSFFSRHHPSVCFTVNFLDGISNSRQICTKLHKCPPHHLISFENVMAFQLIRLTIRFYSQIKACGSLPFAAVSWLSIFLHQNSQVDDFSTLTCIFKILPMSPFTMKEIKEKRTK